MCLTDINCGHNSLSSYLCRKSRLIYSQVCTLCIDLGHLHTLTASRWSWLDLDRKVSADNDCKLRNRLSTKTSSHNRFLFQHTTELFILFSSEGDRRVLREFVVDDSVVVPGAGGDEPRLTVSASHPTLLISEGRLQPGVDEHYFRL